MLEHCDMTVHELITALETFPPEMEVMVNGPEGGISPIESPEKIRIMCDYWKNLEVTCYGPHDEITGRGEPYDAEVVCIHNAS
jgi:hypothetical protein